MQIIYSGHWKGGCGKTTVLYDLTNYLAQNGKKCAVVDLDIQGAITSTILDDDKGNYSCGNNDSFLENLGKSPIYSGDPSNSIGVIHYPLMMFYSDGKTKYKDAYKEKIADLRDKIDFLLTDYPPLHKTRWDANPLALASSEEDDITSLIITRPLEKEILDGLEAYNHVKSLFFKEGKAKKFDAIIVENFGGNVRDRSEYADIMDICCMSVEPLQRTRFTTDTRDADRTIKGFPVACLPEVLREGDDLKQYSVSKDVGFTANPDKVSLFQVINGSRLDNKIQKEAYAQYWEEIGRIAEILLDGREPLMPVF